MMISTNYTPRRRERQRKVSQKTGPRARVLPHRLTCHGRACNRVQHDATERDRARGRLAVTAGPRASSMHSYMESRMDIPFPLHRRGI